MSQGVPWENIQGYMYVYIYIYIYIYIYLMHIVIRNIRDLYQSETVNSQRLISKLPLAHS